MESPSLQLRKAAEARHVSGVSLGGGQERPLYEVVKVKPGFHWRSQDVGDDKVVRYLPRTDANKVQNQPKREKCVAVNKPERSADLKSTLTSDMRYILSLLCLQFQRCSPL